MSKACRLLATVLASIAGEKNSVDFEKGSFSEADFSGLESVDSILR